MKFLGPLIAVYAGIIQDILRYFTLVMVFFIPYVICFWVIFGGPQSASLTGSAKKDLSTVFHVTVMTLRMMLVDSYPYDVRIGECLTFPTCSNIMCSWLC